MSVLTHAGQLQKKSVKRAFHYDLSCKLFTPSLVTEYSSPHISCVLASMKESGDARPVEGTEGSWLELLDT